MTSTTYISEPHDGTIFIMERARAGSRKVVCSAMPAAAAAADVVVPLRTVPLAIRRAGRAALGLETEQDRQARLRESATERRPAELTHRCHDCADDVVAEFSETCAGVGRLSCPSCGSTDLSPLSEDDADDDECDDDV